MNNIAKKDLMTRTATINRAERQFEARGLIARRRPRCREFYTIEFATLSHSGAISNDNGIPMPTISDVSAESSL